jgi:hypothetical protein
MGDKPLVSVIVISLNEAKFIREAVGPDLFVSQRARVLGLRGTEQSARVYRGCRVVFLHS